ncbi:MAG: hypothetical protein AB8U40_01320 [Anaplasma ovis]
MFDFCAGEPDFLFVYISLLRGTATGVLCVRASLPDGCGLRTRDSRELCAFPPLSAFLVVYGRNFRSVVWPSELLPEKYTSNARRYAVLAS